jgi:hypothetical protein
MRGWLLRGSRSKGHGSAGTTDREGGVEAARGATGIVAEGTGAWGMGKEGKSEDTM